MNIGLQENAVRGHWQKQHKTCSRFPDGCDPATSYLRATVPLLPPPLRPGVQSSTFACDLTASPLLQYSVGIYRCCTRRAAELGGLSLPCGMYEVVMASEPSLLTVADVGWPEVHRSCRPIDVGCRVIPGPKSAWIGFGAVGYTSPPQTLRHPASPRPLHQPFTALGAAPTCYATASQTLYPSSASLSPQLPNLRTVCKKYLQFYDHLAPLLLPALYPEGPRGQARVGGASGPAWPVPEQMEVGRGALGVGRGAMPGSHPLANPL